MKKALLVLLCLSIISCCFAGKKEKKSGNLIISAIQRAFDSRARAFEHKQSIFTEIEEFEQTYTMRSFSNNLSDIQAKKFLVKLAALREQFYSKLNKSCPFSSSLLGIALVSIWGSTQLYAWYPLLNSFPHMSLNAYNEMETLVIKNLFLAHGIASLATLGLFTVAESKHYFEKRKLQEWAKDVIDHHEQKLWSIIKLSSMQQ